MWISYYFGRLFISCLLKSTFSSLMKKLNQKKSPPFGNRRGYLKTLGSFISKRLKDTMLIPEGYLCHTGHFARTIYPIGSKSAHLEQSHVFVIDHEFSQPIWPHSALFECSGGWGSSLCWIGLRHQKLSPPQSQEFVYSENFRRCLALGNQLIM